VSGDPAKQTEATTEQDIRDRLDRSLPKLMEKHEVSGVAIAVRLADGHVFDYPAGTDANGTEVTPTTWFRVASVTKLMTALTVLRLVEKEKLRLDHVQRVVSQNKLVQRAGTDGPLKVAASYWRRRPVGRRHSFVSHTFVGGSDLETPRANTPGVPIRRRPS